jgi:hypothetical protein
VDEVVGYFVFGQIEGYLPSKIALFQEVFLLKSVDNLLHYALESGDDLVKYLFSDVAVLDVNGRHRGLAQDR